MESGEGAEINFMTEGIKYSTKEIKDENNLVTFVPLSTDADKRRETYEEYGAELGKRIDPDARETLISMLERTPTPEDFEALIKSFARNLIIRKRKYKPNKKGVFTPGRELKIESQSQVVIYDIEKRLEEKRAFSKKFNI